MNDAAGELFRGILRPERRKGRVAHVIQIARAIGSVGFPPDIRVTRYRVHAVLIPPVSPSRWW